LLELKKLDLPLGISIFTNSLLSATMQDGGMRERSDNVFPPFSLLFISLQFFIYWKKEQKIFSILISVSFLLFVDNSL